MHDQLPESFFEIIGSSAAEFSIYYLIAIIFANLAGIVVQPHFIATGGGSAKSEQDARVGLVVGNFLKRFCTLGWVFHGSDRRCPLCRCPGINRTSRSHLGLCLDGTAGTRISRLDAGLLASRPDEQRRCSDGSRRRTDPEKPLHALYQT